MGIYSDLETEDLATEIAAMRQARRDILLGAGGGVGSVKRVSDGDRTIEYTSANIGSLETELRNLLAEMNRRTGASTGNALLVEFD